MEEFFNKLKEEGKNTVDNLVKWMQDSKLVDSTKDSEEKVRKMFVDVANKSNVEYKQFQGVVSKIAEEQKKSLEELYKKLLEEGSNIVKGAAAAAPSGAQAALDNAKSHEGLFGQLLEEGSNIKKKIAEASKTGVQAATKAFIDTMKK